MGLPPMAGTVTGVASRGVFSIVKAPLVFLLSHWKVVLMVLAFSSLFLQTVQDIKDEKSTSPLFLELGKRIVFSDQKLYNAVNDDNTLNINLIKGNGLWIKIKNTYRIALAYADLFMTVYIVGLFFYGIYLLVQLRNTSAMGANIAITIIIMMFLQIGFNLADMSYNLIDDKATYDKEDFKTAFIPFRGVISFIGWLPTIADPVYNYFDVEEKIGLNETIT